MTVDEYLDSIGITPGPWESDTFIGPYSCQSIGVVNGNLGIAYCGEVGNDEEEKTLADARLIAQSREMLKALIDSTLLIEATWECLPQGEMDSLQHTENVAIIESATAQKWETIKEALDG